MAADELTKVLLVEEVAAPQTLAEALFASVAGGVPLPQALIDSGAITPEVLNRYLARTDAPFLRQVVPLFELVDRLPRGMCARLLAIPVRHDAITGTVDIAVVDPGDPHPASEMSFHLNAPVRVLRAPIASIEEALRRLRLRRDKVTLPPQEPALSDSVPSQADVPRRGGLIIETDSTPPEAPAPPPRRTPPWGMPIRTAASASPISEPPKSGYGSEIPIPLTRKTSHPAAVRGGTERPALLLNPSAAFIPGPPPLPGMGPFTAYAPQLPLPEMSGILAALRNASSRDEILELVLTGARTLARKVALFIVRKGGYLGWLGTPEFSDRSALQSVLIPLDANSLFDRAVREDLYLGPIRHDEVHAPLLRIMRSPTRDVAAVPIRVTGKTAVIIVADELGDTMIGTRRLDELARAAGEALARIVRDRR